MTDRRRFGTTEIIPPAFALWRHGAREWRPAVTVLLLRTGLMILPALATLDLAVGIACQTLDRAECVALFLQLPE